MKNRYFAVRVTRDATETAVVPVMASRPEDAGDKAITQSSKPRWTSAFRLDEGNFHTPYLADTVENCTAEISREEFLALSTRAGGPVVSPQDTLLLLQYCNQAVATFAEQFDNDEPVDGGDLVEWFAGWRAELRTFLAQLANGVPMFLHQWSPADVAAQRPDWGPDACETSFSAIAGELNARLVEMGHQELADILDQYETGFSATGALEP